MEAIGMVRRVDDLGRVVIPKETRRMQGINERDSLEFFMGDNGEIILKKYQIACVFCGEKEALKSYRGKKICPGCVADFSAEEN